MGVNRTQWGGKADGDLIAVLKVILLHVYQVKSCGTYLCPLIAMAPKSSTSSQTWCGPGSPHALLPKACLHRDGRLHVPCRERVIRVDTCVLKYDAWVSVCAWMARLVHSPGRSLLTLGHWLPCQGTRMHLHKSIHAPWG